MNPARIIYEDAPAYVQMPEELRHRKVEIIFWPLEGIEPHSVTAEKPQSRWSELFRRFTRDSDIDPGFDRDEIYDDRLR